MREAIKEHISLLRFFLSVFVTAMFAILGWLGLHLQSAQGWQTFTFSLAAAGLGVACVLLCKKILALIKSLKELA